MGGEGEEEVEKEEEEEEKKFWQGRAIMKFINSVK